MRVAVAVLAALAAMRNDPEHRMNVGHCPECGGTGCVPCEIYDPYPLGFKACPRGCPQIADESEEWMEEV